MLHFLSILWMDLCLNWGSCEQQERHEMGKRGYWRPSFPIPPFQVSAPSPEGTWTIEPEMVDIELEQHSTVLWTLFTYVNIVTISHIIFPNQIEGVDRVIFFFFRSKVYTKKSTSYL